MTGPELTLGLPSPPQTVAPPAVEFKQLSSVMFSGEFGEWVMANVYAVYVRGELTTALMHEKKTNIGGPIRVLAWKLFTLDGAELNCRTTRGGDRLPTVDQLQWLLEHARVIRQ